MNLSLLNPMQRKAAETLSGPVLILAGAGSGKTRTITYRIANLIESGVAPWHILALTFTNKAAREMKDRVARLVGSDVEEMWLGTFHSICVRILRRDIEKIGYQRSFTIYDDDDQLRVIKDALKALHYDEKQLPPKEIRGKISDAKNRMLSPDEWFQESPRDYRSQQIHDVMRYYEERLKNANALDFDDLLLCTLQLFVEHPPVLSYYQQKFTHVHVDEYQDTNTAQYTFVRLLTQESRNLCVVGDD
ncbi:MAG: UvrD-helicase domain-containing protein, partial [Clostridia bacterium]|nr:UvrD-helicase domain-containing protein [Clostridia bacterium]